MSHKMKKIDQLESRLLSILQNDASLSIVDLAKAANSSTATCWRRLRSLEERGVIGPPIRLVDPVKVGCGMDAFCQVRMKSQRAEARESFRRAVEVEPKIVEVYSISGEWDYLLHVVVEDMSDLENVLMRRILELECVAGTSTIFVLRRIKHTTEIPV